MLCLAKIKVTYLVFLFPVSILEVGIMADVKTFSCLRFKSH